MIIIEKNNIKSLISEWQQLSAKKSSDLTYANNGFVSEHIAVFVLKRIL